MASDVMSTRTGKGNELRQLLCREFGIPDNAYWFEIRYEVDKPVRVECGYFPKDQRGEG